MWIIIPLREKTGNYDPCLGKVLRDGIIPLREKTGNYDILSKILFPLMIIPLREKTGNYDVVIGQLSSVTIIPLREKTGNYDPKCRLLMILRIIPLREKIGNYDLCYWTSPASWKAFWRRARTVSSRKLRRLELEFEKLQMDWQNTAPKWEAKTLPPRGRPEVFIDLNQIVCVVNTCGYVRQSEM